MKRQNLVVALCLGLAVASCTKDDEPNDFTPERVQMTISAKEADSEVQTRVGYDSDGTVGRFRWNSGDKFSFITNGVAANSNCSFLTESTTARGSFTGTATTWEGSQNVYAVYPYSNTAYTVTGPETLESATVDLSIPYNQSYTVGGSLDNAYMVAAASSTVDNVSLSFKQAASIIKFDIIHVPAGLTVSSVSIDLPGYSIPLKKRVKLSDASASDAPNNSYNNYRKVTVSGAVAGEATTVQMALWPTDLSSVNVNIMVLLSNGASCGFTKAGTNFERNERTSVTLDLDSPTLTYPPTGNPAFESKAIYINGTWWAPVNCGTSGDYTRGLYYQWGRNIGLVPHPNFYTVFAGPTSNPSSGIFYTGSNDWFHGTISGDWNHLNTSTVYAYSGSWSGLGNPCPLGWKVCSAAQLSVLMMNSSAYLNYNGCYGRWYSGGTAYSESGARVFLTMVGLINSGGTWWDLSSNTGSYWTCDRVANQSMGYTGSFSNTSAGGVSQNGSYAQASSVRCVKETY